MSRGRTPRKAASISRACDFVEFLEERKYLTTLTSNSSVIPTIFDYYDADKNTIRIELVGKITAEFIGARVTGTNSVVIRDLVQPPPPNGQGKVDGVNLFQIYVAQAADDAQIIITQINPDATGLHPDPYAGDSGSVNINPNLNPTQRVKSLGSHGAVYIGARTQALQGQPNTGNIPIVFNPRKNAIGVRPAGKPFFAGIQTAVGVSLGKILIGGTISGIVNIAGNVGEFYAGNVITGDATGLIFGQKTTIPNNFTIGGDLRALLVQGSIGTVDGQTGIYTSGTSMRVGGKVGYLHVGGEDSSSIQVINSNSVPSIATPVQEAEYTLLPGETAGDVYLDGLLNGAFFKNDNNAADLAAPSINNNYQFSSSFTSAKTGAPQSVEFQGTLDGLHNDFTDTYSLPLMAGQTVNLHLDSLETASLGVIDPLGRLVATDLPDAIQAGLDIPFQFTAKLPGVYRLVVALPSDTTFSNTPSLRYLTTYTLSATNVGELAVGGVNVDGNAIFTDPGIGFAVRTGDLGALQVGNELGAFTTRLDGSDSSFAAARGNIRFLAGDTIGNEDAGAIGGQTSNFNLSGRLYVPRGSVGYLLSNGTMTINPDASDSTGQFDPRQAVGFDYQRVETRTGALDSNLVANGRIGTIVAASVGQSNILLRPVFSVNADGKGTDGTIDAIYVAGDFGAAGIGGPAFYTGPGGNIKYMHVGGTTYRDSKFGLSARSETLGLFGKPLSFTDDSGARVLITPTSDVTGTTTANTVATITRGQLDVVTYPVRDKGGSVLVSVRSTTGVDFAGLNTGGSVDIGQVYIAKTGDAVNYSASFNTVGFPAPSVRTSDGVTRTVTSPVATAVNAITFTGRAPINVLNITGQTAPLTSTTIQGFVDKIAVDGDPFFNPNITSIANATGGEIASINVASLGNFVAQSAGFIKSSTAAEVDVPTNISSTAFPFNRYSTGLNVTDSAISVSVRDGLGNFNAGNAVGSIITNADGRNAKNAWDGINGAVAGRVVQKVYIGEGIAAGGTGEVVGGGVFGIGPTAEIQNVIGTNADIRGYVASEDRIDNIILNNGSLLGARVMTTTTIAQAAFNNNGFIIAEFQFNNGQSETPPGPLILPPGQLADTTLDYSLGTINIAGTGGILGSYILAGDFNIINAGGFGIVSSQIATTGSSNPNNVLNAGGLGIRDSIVDLGSGAASINADGTGNVLNVNNFSGSARQSLHSHFDVAGTGRLLGASNDLNRALGTSRSRPKISGSTNSGLITNTTISGNGTINKLNAFLIGSTDNSLPLSSAGYPMQISVADGIGKVTTQYVSGLQMTTGTLGNFQVAKTMEKALITTTGAIGTVAVGGNMLGSTTITAGGPQGSIGTISVGRALYGTITSQIGINKIGAGSIGGIINTSNNINSILVNGDLLPTADIRARKKIGSLFVAGDVETGAQVHAQSYGTIHIGGKNHGTVTTA